MLTVIIAALLSWLGVALYARYADTAARSIAEWRWRRQWGE